VPAAVPVMTKDRRFGYEAAGHHASKPLVFLHGIGGAAQYYARTMEKVLGVYLTEFGIPESMWHLRVRDFAAIVTMDAHGNSLHADVEKETGEALASLQHV